MLPQAAIAAASATGQCDGLEPLHLLPFEKDTIPIPSGCSTAGSLSALAFCTKLTKSFAGALRATHVLHMGTLPSDH